jgi:MFS family permease
MQTVAQSWLVYRLTGSSLLLGTTGFIGQIPILLLAPVGGAVADRYNRHRIIVGTQVASMLLALVLGALTLAGRIEVWHIIFMAGLLGVVNAFDIPTRQSFFIEMVGKEDLLNAIALNSSMFNTARVVGPAVAGVLVAAIGEGWCFLLNGISYLAVIAGLLLMRLSPPAPARARGSALDELLGGVRFAWSARPLAILLGLLGIVSVAGAPYTVLMPVFAGGILKAGPRGLGLLMGATGVGAVIGALGIAARSGVGGLGRMLGRACAGFGAGLALFSLSRNLWLSLALLVPVGFSMMTHLACTNTLIQTMVPDRIRGRIMALYSVMLMGIAPFGALLAGALAEKIGAPATVAAGGLICLVAAGTYWLRLPTFRREARALIEAASDGGQSVPVSAPGGTDNCQSS